MDNSNFLLIFCIVVFLALGLPISIFLALRRGEEIELLKRATQRARDPWRPEKDNLSELSKRVEDLKAKSEKPK